MHRLIASYFNRVVVPFGIRASCAETTRIHGARLAGEGSLVVLELVNRSRQIGGIVPLSRAALGDGSAW